MINPFAITSIDRIIYVGKEEYPEKLHSFCSNLEWYELIYRITGNSVMYFDGKKYFLNPGTVYILPKGNYSEYRSEHLEEQSCIDIFFKADRDFTNEVIIKNVDPNSNIKNLFNKAFSVWAAKNEGYYFECLSVIYSILYELNHRLYISNSKLDKIKPAIDYINNNFTDEDISAEDLSNRCGISYSYLKQIFAKQYKLSPIKYIINMRINYACDLLREKNLTVSQIALLAGFTDVYYFSKCFKKSVGITPTQFKNKYISSK